MRYFYLICFILYLLFTFTIKTLSAEDVLFFIPKTIFILPQSSFVKIKWVIPPELTTKSQHFSFDNTDKIKFIMDYDNKPLIVYNNKLIFYPTTGYVVKTMDYIKDVICLDSGVLLFSDGIKIGYLELVKNSENIPMTKLKSITLLPLPESKLFKGDETLYAVGFNKSSKKYEVYLFNSKTKLFNRIIYFNEPIKALSGKGEHFFFSNGKIINEFKNSTISIVYIHPREEIEELFYNEKTGLIYKTSTGIGIVKDKAALEFLQTENPIVFLKETTLYVFFTKVLGLLEIANIDDLRNFNFKVQKVIDIQHIFKEKLP